ncbi:MAG TPA: GNAT family N-acetyltransferase [Actinomycetes bacterium]|nr:GNAT family N-acetyltransferase [Actinomycetes bacterium]
MSVELRPAEPADLAQVAAIFGHYVRTSCATFEEVVPEVTAWTTKLDEARGRGWPFLVAADVERVRGFARCAPWRPPAAYLHTAEESIYLAPGDTGRGLGTRLLTRLLEEAARAGIHQLLAVIADTGDPASMQLHERLGFARVGLLRRVGLKQGRWLDTAIYQRELAALI